MATIKAALEKHLKKMARAGTVARAGFAGGAYENGTSIPYVAAIQEYGAPEVNIPARPFMRNAVAQHKGEWVGSAAKFLQAASQGNGSAHGVLDKIGAVMEGDIKLSISETFEPPLSPVTVMLRGMRQHDANLKVTRKTVGQAARRVAQSKTNYGAPTKPLVDTGLLLASVTHDVETP